MGWLISYDFSKKEQVADLIKGWDIPDTNRKQVCIGHSVRGNVLYAVFQHKINDVPSSDAYIGVFLLRKDRGMGWGYKDMTESCGPYVYDCPEKIFKLAPVVTNPDWREQCRNKAASKKAAPPLVPGTVVYFKAGYKSGDGDSLDDERVTILRKQGRGYIGEFDSGMTIKLFRRHIALDSVPRRRAAILAQKARA
jgi:hypothetical protein